MIARWVAVAALIEGLNSGAVSNQVRAMLDGSLDFAALADAPDETDERRAAIFSIV